MGMPCSATEGPDLLHPAASSSLPPSSRLKITRFQHNVSVRQSECRIAPSSQSQKRHVTPGRSMEPHFLRPACSIPVPQTGWNASPASLLLPHPSHSSSRWLSRIALTRSKQVGQSQALHVTSPLRKKL